MSWSGTVTVLLHPREHCAAAADARWRSNPARLRGIWSFIVSWQILPFPTSSTQNLGAAKFFAQTSDTGLTLCQPGLVVLKITLCFEADPTAPILRANVTSVWTSTQLGVHVD